jgi:predicted regulator of Ras-like GTPase activity (Roadblock/LC7/MglB family)
MSKSPTRPSNPKTDRTAAVTLEVPKGVADDIEAVLRDYAEEAELDTSLVVDHSGFLIAGISSLPDVDVDTIGSLVAGAGDATEGLTGALGEEGSVESLHLGEDRLFYLKDIGERYILVGVSDSNVPAGILRDQASLIEPSLLKLLEKVKVLPNSLTRQLSQINVPVPEAQTEPPKSLRQKEPKTGEETAAPESTRPKARPVAATISQARKSGSNDSEPDDPAPEKPLPQKDPFPESSFEFDEADMAVPRDSNPGTGKPSASIESKKVEPLRVVENSPFEVDEEDEDGNFTKPVRPQTTPVHLSVPAAREREAAARKEQVEDDDDQSGRHYSFELG